VTETPRPSAPGLGSLTIDRDKATMVFQRRLSHPPEAVWKALTDPVEFSKWHLTEASIEGRLGGRVRFTRSPQRFEVTGRILTWDPPRVFEHEWKVTPWEHAPKGEDSVIRWELRPEGTDTVLTLRHRNLTRQFASVYIAGTHAFLDRLEAQLDGRPLPTMARSAEVRDLYPIQID